MALTAEDIEKHFNKMYSDLTEIQDPFLLREVLEEVMKEHPLVSGGEGEINLLGNADEGVQFARGFARKCNELLGTPEDFFLKYFHWEADGPTGDAPEIEEITGDLQVTSS